MGKENPFYAWRLILVYFVYLHNVSSGAATREDNKKKDTLIDRIKFCDTVFVIANSSYVKTCDTFNYPNEFLPDNTNLALCMLVYDTTSKICEYSSKVPYTVSAASPLTLPASSQQLDKDIEKFETFNNSTDVCKNISSIFNKLNHSKIEGYKDLIPYLEHSQNKLLSNEQCSFTCHSIGSRKINHLCTYLLWANEFFSILKPITIEDNEENLHGKEAQPKAKAAVTLEKHENNSEKQDPQVIDNKNEPKEIDKSPNIVSKSENQQESKLKVPANSNKKTDDVPKNPTNDVNTSNNEPKNNPSDQKQVDELNKQGSLPVPPKEEDTADVVESKKNDGDVDQIPPNDANQEADSVSVEDHQKHYEPEEGIDRESMDIDPKESNNPRVDVPMKNPDENDEFQQRQNFISHSQNLKAEEESHFFTYFSLFSLFCILLYFGYHNKQKIFAFCLEGRRSRRGRGSRRRPSTASYRKLDCNLEEAVTSQCNSNVTHVIY